MKTIYVCGMILFSIIFCLLTYYPEKEITGLGFIRALSGGVVWPLALPIIVVIVITGLKFKNGRFMLNDDL